MSMKRTLRKREIRVYDLRFAQPVVNNYGRILRYAAIPPVLPLSRLWE